MSNPPSVLIPHLLTRQFSAERARKVRDALTDELPDLDVTLAESEAASLEAVTDADIVVCKGITPALLDRAEQLRWIQGLSSGLQRFTDDDYVTGYTPPGLDRIADEGIALTNAAGVHAEPVGEQVLGYLLAFERNLHRAVRQQAAGEWGGYGGAHGELEDKCLGVIGTGSIGGRVAELGEAVGMTVVGTRRDPTSPHHAVDELYDPGSLDELLADADYVVVSCPLTEETRGLIGAHEFTTMADDAVLVNIARGAIVDESALVNALRSGEIRGAALDVFETEPLPADSPLWEMENVVVTPHVAGSSPRREARVADLFARNYERFRAGDFDAFENRIV